MSHSLPFICGARKKALYYHTIKHIINLKVLDCIPYIWYTMYIHSRCIWYWTDTFVMLMLLKRGDMSRSNQPNKFLFCANALKKSLMTVKKIVRELVLQWLYLLGEHSRFDWKWDTQTTCVFKFKDRLVIWWLPKVFIALSRRWTNNRTSGMPGVKQPFNSKIFSKWEQGKHWWRWGLRGIKCTGNLTLPLIEQCSLIDQKLQIYWRHSDGLLVYCIVRTYSKFFAF